MDHNFNINIAQRFGVEEAILIHNIYFWVKKNAANEKHALDGRYWTYNSVKSFTILFPYWTHRQLERIINNAVEKGALLKGSQNKKNYDRTCWYTVTDLTISIYAKGDIHFPKPCNGFPQTVKPIPDSNTDSKPIKKQEDNIYPSFDDFWNLYGKKVSRNTCEKKWKKLKQEDKIKIMEHIPIYFKHQPDSQFRKLPETFLNKRSWEDELDTPSTIQKSKTKITMF